MVHLHLKLKNGDFRMEHLHKPNGWKNSTTRKNPQALKDDLGMSLEDHTRKQVQMNAVARRLTKKFGKNVPPEFGRTFEYIKVFFAVFKEQPVTFEEYVEGEFQKYVNNNGMCITSPAEG